MVKIKQILGAILSDITKAQAISDVYSRDLKPSYREDPFLKLLSVPRTEIKDITIDLKFAILKHEPEQWLESNVILYQRNDYIGDSEKISQSVPIYKSKVSSMKIPKGIRVTLYENGELTGRSKSFTEDTPAVGDDFDFQAHPGSVKVEYILEPYIETMEVEVVTDYLKSLPEAAISSISIKLDMTSV